ncbi:MAG TPA: exopolysaccharide biosynthesis polyprenyl glycosylphosphotransferase [Vicinamibacterales bacterium]|jgi:exopolysaccharide biosynthesis polyprenyl glycosylphosphotransferase|nr:exopolysaccharide biosynthesis polyprenyl glycosylphosphotransferase [Vicinamibacterales bacterium]
MQANLLILGAGPMAARLIDEVEALEFAPYVVAGVVDNQRPDPESPIAQRWLGTCDELDAIVARVRPTRIVVAIENRRDGLPLQSLLESRVSGIDVEDAIELYERITGKIAIEALRPSTLILSKGFRNHGAAEMTARMVSVLAAVIGLVICAPLLAAIALFVKLDSEGPVLFVQPRAGRHGRSFGLLKFRTMHPTDEPSSEWAVDNVHRITRVGRYLRRFRLDELPQLINVLRGEMNLIGPRPHPVSNHSTFMEHIAYYGLRSTVRPGVTGWAQVRYGYANNLDEETEKMRYDLYYIKNRTLWLDLRIMFATIGIVLFGQDAAEVRHPAPMGRDLWAPAPRVLAKEIAYLPVLADQGTPHPTTGPQ